MAIGFIDWAEDEVSLYTFQRKLGNYSLKDAKSVRLEGGLNRDSLLPLAASDLDNIHLSLPPGLFSFRELRFPFSDRNKIRDIISYELEGSLIGNVIDYSIGYIITETAEDKSQVLAACIEKKKLQEIIDTFSSIGLEPKYITSIDLRLSGGESKKLLEVPVSDTDTRVNAAIGELSGLSMNLRQDDLAYKKDIERIKRTFQLSTFLLLILLLILCTNAVIKKTSLKKEHTALSRQITGLFRNAFPEDKKIVDPARQFKANLSSLKKKSIMLSGMPILDILQDITDLKKSNITLYEFVGDNNNIVIKGTAASFKEVESFKRTLASKFEDVRVSDSSSTAEKKITFTIVMKERAI